MEACKHISHETSCRPAPATVVGQAFPVAPKRSDGGQPAGAGGFPVASSGFELAKRLPVRLGPPIRQVQPTIFSVPLSLYGKNPPGHAPCRLNFPFRSHFLKFQKLRICWGILKKRSQTF